MKSELAGECGRREALLVGKYINRILERTPLVRSLRMELGRQAEALRESQGRLDQHLEAQGAFEAGHYYSPVPSRDEVRAYLEKRRAAGGDLSGLEMNTQSQREMLEQFAAFYEELPFPEQKVPDHRYFYENDWFGYSDAIFLYCFLRKFEPAKIIEVGSGFSSAVMLDTADAIDAWNPEMTFIEPYPERLNSLLTDSDRQRVTLIDRKVQEVSFDIFSGMAAGDLLFIDSSHVVKCGSDLQSLLFEILPRIEPGVFVHFHDVFHPFDYPSEWLLEGRYWNENYFLRAFLSYNSEWRIVFFNTYVHLMFGDWIEARMPLCARNPGGSLYIQRSEECAENEI